MPTLYDVLSTSEQLGLAVRMQRPAQLAQIFASHAGQFYDRAAFDALARQVSALYAVASVEDAGQFRRRLDRRLHDRCHAPVVWEVHGRDARG